MGALGVAGSDGVGEPFMLDDGLLAGGIRALQRLFEQLPQAEPGEMRRRVARCRPDRSGTGGSAWFASRKAVAVDVVPSARTWVSIDSSRRYSPTARPARTCVPPASTASTTPSSSTARASTAARSSRSGRRKPLPVCRRSVLEHPPEHLAAGVLGYLVGDLDDPGVLVGGHPFPGEGLDLVRVGLGAGLETDVGLHGLAAVGVGNPDDGRLQHRRDAGTAPLRPRAATP